MRNDVKSLRAGIFSEIIIVFLPLTMLLIYQTVSDITVSDRLADTHRLLAASSSAYQRYRLFVNGVVDAIDTGRVSEDAVHNLEHTTVELKSITTGDRSSDFSSLAARTNALLAHLRKDRSFGKVLPLRDTINGIDADLSALAAQCDETNRQMILENINSTQSRKIMVFTALALGALVTLALIVMLIRHVTRFELVLRESEERMRVMFESINAGIVLIDCDNNSIVDVNPTALRLHGGTKEELIGYPSERLFHGDNVRTDPEHDEGKAIDISKGMLSLCNGERLPVLESVNYVAINGRRYMLKSFVDLSKQMTLETELLAAKEAAEAASRAKSIFLASMSHEIRTPMNAIIGYAQLLKREGNLAPQQGQYLNVINNSGEHLLKLINDILEMSKIESGTVNLTPVPFNFHNLLHDVESLFADRARQKKLRFDVRLQGEVPVVLDADEMKVRQVLINMIGNALKFTDEGTIAVTVSSSTDSPDKERDTYGETAITVDVEDSGIGISAEEADQVFALFEQTESGRRRIGGTGLGMPISRQFARLMGGDLFLVRGEPGIGSAFRFVFRAKALDLAEFKQPAVDERFFWRIIPDEKEWRVLVVDDQENNRSLLSHMLTRAGFAVREADGGIDGVAQFRAWLPDIVLMDILMPDMDGYEALRQIKATSEGGVTPVIAVTASVMMDEHQKALDLGFDGFIMKPVSMECLFEEIRRLTNVAYLYDDSRSSGDAAAEILPPWVDRLTTLPDVLLGAMRDALEAGDIASLRGLIEQIGESEPIPAEALRRLVDSYSYDELTTLLAGGDARYASA
ncbi:response regulator [Geobacter metallireducens]|nr:response regulator [Geobacter metallireducens]